MMTRRAMLLAGAVLTTGLSPAGNGRLKGCVIVPSRVGVGFRVTGAWRIDGARYEARGQEVPVAPGTAPLYLVGTVDGVVLSRREPDAEGALLARIDQSGASWPHPVAHHSWLTFFPPVDDAAAWARKRSYDDGGLAIPGKDRRFGPDPAGLTDLTADPRWQPRHQALFLTPASPMVEGAVLRDGSVWHDGGEPGHFARNAVIRGCAFLTGSDRFAASIAGRAPSMGVADFPTLPDARQDELVAALRLRRPEAITVEDCIFQTAIAPGAQDTPRGLLHYGRQTVRRCTFQGVVNMVEYGAPGGVFEDIHVHDVGHGERDHGNSIILQTEVSHAVRDGDGRWRGGGSRWRRFHFDQPSSGSPRYRGAQSTANISFWGGAGGMVDAGHVFEQGRISGGAYCIDINPWPGTAWIGDITFRDVAFGRDHAFNGNPHPLLMIRAPARDRWGNIRFERCFWEDSGEAIDDLNGTWQPGPGGIPQRHD